MKLANLWRKNKKTPYGFFGAYSTWEEASKYTAGYMSPSVNQFNLKTRKNLIAGLNNEFRLDDKSLQIIAGVCSILTDKQKTSLKVLDFGGSWGRYFYVLRHALPHVSIDWTVVEMNETVQAQKPFEESKLRWIDSMPTLSDIKHEKYDVFLASGALAYTPTPYQILEKATAISNYIIVTRHALTFTAEDILVIQKVSPEIYEGSMPCWLFSEQKFVNFLWSLGVLRWQWDVAQDMIPYRGKPVPHRGYLVKI